GRAILDEQRGYRSRYILIEACIAWCVAAGLDPAHRDSRLRRPKDHLAVGCDLLDLGCGVSPEGGQHAEMLLQHPAHGGCREEGPGGTLPELWQTEGMIQLAVGQEDPAKRCVANSRFRMQRWKRTELCRHLGGRVDEEPLTPVG